MLVGSIASPSEKTLAMSFRWPPDDERVIVLDTFDDMEVSKGLMSPAARLYDPSRELKGDT
jgi:hypothetical protein